MKLEEFDYDLPAELIAQHPAPERDKSRLLVLNRADASIQHRGFRDIVDFLAPADALALNQTRVIKARLRGRKAETGGQVELLLVRQEEGGNWLAIGRPGRRLAPGTRLEFAGGRLGAEVVGRDSEERFLIRFEGEDAAALIEEAGEIPLPPYIRRPPDAADSQRYQTVFARRDGAVAAPTAGLHFSLPLLKEIEFRGIAIAPLVLHVGPGTFAPIRADDPRQHVIESEYYEVEEESAAALRRCRWHGGRIAAVGTTAVRALESAAPSPGVINAARGWTEKFIYPPYAFKAVDILVTNFHLPRSSLLLLVAAFAGREFVLEAYRRAVAERYRFYSYGDAMLIL